MEITKRIVIHAGPGKTGTSAIQAWLLKNQKTLLELGIFYPTHSIQSNNVSSGNVREILSNSNGEWIVDKDKLNNILSEFNKKDSHLLLLSSEFFFKNILNLYEFLPNAEFIIYLRNPLELFESNYNQGVKRNGSVDKIKLPESLGNYLLNSLDRIYTEIPNKQIKIRPYEQELFTKGNIVSDFLNCLELNIDVDNQIVNPSYTFPALEFKRLLNNFDLGELDGQLDFALQQYNIGLTKFSFISSVDSTRLLSEVIIRIQSFIKNHNQVHLFPLLDSFLREKDNQVVSHSDILASELIDICNYLANDFPKVYAMLRYKVNQNSNLHLDNTMIYDVFGVVSDCVSYDYLIDDSLLACVESFNIMPSKRGKVSYELACYFSSQNEWDNALKFSQAAYYFDPENISFEKLVNTLLIKINKLKDAGKSDPNNTLFVKLYLRMKSNKQLRKLKSYFNF